MKVSAVLALRALASKIHPPLPLTPRESQQLLSLLTSSFREQLDREHPSFRTEGGGKTQYKPLEAPRGKAMKQRSNVHAPASARASSTGFTDRHFESIFRNPLFAATMKDRHESVSSNYPTQNQDQSHHQTTSFDPMAWFETGVASGSATIAKATYAMDTLQKILTSSPETSVKQGMATSLAGSKVLRWLWSSGLHDSLDFSTDAKFIALLTSYLLAEKRHDVILNWLHELHGRCRRSLLEISTGYQSGPIHFAQRLLLQMVRSELALGNGIEAAVKLFQQVVDDVYATRLGAEEFQLFSSLLWPTGKYLVDTLTHKGGGKQLDPKVLERFTQSIKTWARNTEVYRAEMHLYQPLHPNAAPALAYLKRRAVIRKMEGPRQRRAIVHLSLDCARLLLQQGQYSEATWVMTFLQRGYATELGIAKGRLTDEVAGKGVFDRSPSKNDEISNLVLLARLDAD